MSTTYRIGPKSQEVNVEQGGQVHHKDTLKNYYFIECSCGISMYGTPESFCTVEDSKRKVFSFYSYELRKGWVSKEVQDKLNEEKKQAKEQAKQKKEEKKMTRIQRATNIINNTQPINFKDAILNFPEETIFYFKSGGRLKGFYVEYFKSESEKSNGYLITSQYVYIYIYDVETNEGKHVVYNVNDLDNIKKSVYTDTNQSQQSSSSASGAGAGAGAGASASAQVNESPVAKEKRECLEFLRSQGINEYKDFWEWATKGGHPNKGGDTELFKKVSDCMDKTLKQDKENQKSQQGGVTKKHKFKKTKGKTKGKVKGKSRKH